MFIAAPLIVGVICLQLLEFRNYVHTSDRHDLHYR